MRTRLPLLSLLLVLFVATAGNSGCSSDPNVEGAKLYIRNQDYPQALASLGRALESNPDNVDALVLKMEVLRLQTENMPAGPERQAAIDELTQTALRLQTLAPGNAQFQQTRVAAWAQELNRGVPLLQGDDAAGSTTFFRNAVAILPDSSQGHFFLGVAHLVGGNADQAITPLERAYNLDRRDPDNAFYLSQAYIQTQRGSQALEVLEQAVQANPNDDRLRRALLNAYSATGQADRAFSAYREQIALNPNDALLRYNYGSLLLAADRYDEAIEQLERAVEIDGNNVDARYNLGAAYQNKAKALQDEAEALSLNEQARYDQLIAERNALLERSIPHFEAARRIAQPQDQQLICDALLVVYNALGRTAEAEGVAACAGRSMN